MSRRKIQLWMIFLLILASASCNSQDSPDAATPTPMPTVVRVIEAENCERVPGCRLEGAWRFWDAPGFSNGRLIHNEASPGRAAGMELILTFEGTGIIVVYRQDTWYGTLLVDIDGNIESLDQRGPVQDQAEARFETDSDGRHTLRLTGSEKTGVVAIDAIKITRGKVSRGQSSYVSVQ